MKWLCDGISLSSSVTSSVPPVCPRSYRLSPGPGWLPPTWSPAEPWRFGRAKLLFPSPPYVVPSSEKSAVFCESGRSWPLHHAQPFGAKLNGKILISATNGSAISGLLGWAREDPEEGDDVVDAEVGLHVLVRLTATRRLDRLGVQLAVRTLLEERLRALAVGEEVSSGVHLRTGGRRRHQRVGVLGHLLRRQRHRLDAGQLTHREVRSCPRVGALVYWHAAPEIREVEGALAVSAVGRADELEERLVLGDRELRPVAEHPPRRREVAGEHPDFANVWLSHRASSLVRGGEDALECDAEAQHRERLLVRMGLGPAGHRDRVRCQVRVRRRRLVGQIRCREVVPGRRRVRVVVEDRDELVVRGKLRHDDR